MRKRFPARLAEAVDRAKILGIRAGPGPHRFIGVWPIVVDGRVFIRSWTRSPGGWYRAFREDPRGRMQVGSRIVRVRAVPARSERLRAAVDRGYAAKYPTPGSRAYVRGFRRPTRRETTTELVPR